jgi:predicted flap endonuclease-1-like 5' DNA nuclease
LDVPVRQLPPFDRQRVATPAEEPVPASSLNEINRQLNAIAEEMDVPPKVLDRPAWNSEEFPGELTDRVRTKTPEPSREPDARDADLAAEYFLLERSPIQEAPSIDAATAERFRKIGVLLVRDLLRLDAAEAADRLRHAGITAPMIRRWQAESLLACRIPRLRPYDARILVACGITAPDQLAQLEAEELLRRVEHFATTSTGDVLLRAGNRYELSRLTEWIRAARRGRPRSHAASEVAMRPLRPQHDDERRTRTPAARGQREDSGPPATPERAARHRAPQPVVLKMEANAAPKKFYLESSDTIEQAPSIGPRMAERLQAVGVRTVADLLDADPAATAARLKRRGVDADVIRTWQQQAALVCRVPWLRGHDAQILVACGVTDPEMLAKLDAAAFWKKVQPLAASAEGKRILRTSKAPDLEEVTQWIQWAGQARTVRAA